MIPSILSHLRSDSLPISHEKVVQLAVFTLAFTVTVVALKILESGYREWQFRFQLRHFEEIVKTTTFNEDFARIDIKNKDELIELRLNEHARRLRIDYAGDPKRLKRIEMHRLTTARGL